MHVVYDFMNHYGKNVTPVCKINASLARKTYSFVKLLAENGNAN